MCGCDGGAKSKGVRRSSGGGGSRSRYNPRNSHAPSHSPPPVIVAPQRRSMFRDAASIAGGVTVGTTVGHLAGEAISSLFTGGRRREVEQALPRDYHIGTEPAGPCAYEISQFMQCAGTQADLNECQQFNAALQECKRRNRLP